MPRAWRLIHRPQPVARIHFFLSNARERVDQCEDREGALLAGQYQRAGGELPADALLMQHFLDRLGIRSERLPIALRIARTKPSLRSSRFATSCSMAFRTSASDSCTFAVCFRENSTTSTASQM